MRRDIGFGEMSTEGREQLAAAIRRGINDAREAQRMSDEKKCTDWSKCRSCGADILWAKTRTGKNMPVDAVPDMRPADRKGGDFVLATRGGEYGTLHTEKYDPRFHDAKRNRYTSHFATCPKSDAHRKEG